MKSNKYDDILKNIDKPIAFVLGSYVSTGLGVARCLGRKKVSVIWLDSNRRQIGFLSKYCTGIVCPDPKVNPDEYIDFLIHLGKKLNHKGVLLPIRDIEALVILKNRDKLEKFYYIPMAELEVAEKLLNKHMFYETLKKFDIDHPKIYFPNDMSEVEAFSKKVMYPCIVKPSYSAYFVLDFKTKVFKAESSEQLIKSYKKAFLKNHEVMIQEIIPGEAKCMHGFNAYYDKNFTPNGVFMFRRIREWPHDFGNGCFIESAVIPELEEIINFLIKKIKYYGIIDAEFKKDPRDNKFKLIEINPRCWMQNSLPARCGVNLPHMAYMEAIGKHVEKAVCKKENVKWLSMLEDIQSSLKSMKKRELSIEEWICSFRGEKEYAIFAWDDPIPFFTLYTKSIYFTIPHMKLLHKNHKLDESIILK
jgi:predicted ATP-grasp superfamily ATP-dependent carboligase